MGEENSGAFKCVKITLIVLYVISIIAIVFFIEVVIFGLIVFESTDWDQGHKSTPEEKENASMKSIIFKID